MGKVVGERLPYRLAGIVYYARTVFLPSLVVYIRGPRCDLRRKQHALFVAVSALSVLGVQTCSSNRARCSIVLPELPTLAFGLLRVGHMFRIPAWSKALRFHVG